MAHFSPFDIGQIKAHAYHRLSADRIAEILVKPKRGPGRKKLYWTKGVVQRIINKLEDEPGWRGEREEGSGATRKTTKCASSGAYMSEHSLAVLALLRLIGSTVAPAVVV